MGIKSILLVHIKYTYTHLLIVHLIPSLLFQFADRGIIMTFGSGSNGCLGHGNFNDVTQVHVHLSKYI